MSLSLYMDLHVPFAITTGLRLRGLDVITGQEDGRDETPDETLLLRATELGRALFSQDDDLIRVAASWQLESRAFSGVIYAHQLSMSIGALVHDLELLLTCSSAEEIGNRVTYLPL